MVKEEKSRYKTASYWPYITRSMLLLIVWLILPITGTRQTSEEPTVQAILFYSPSCPHCHQALKEIMIPLKEQYGHQLQIVGIDTMQPNGEAFFLEVTKWFEIPENRQVVPTLIVGETVLVSRSEIADQFPSLIEEGLASGGIGWPDIPDLNVVLPDLLLIDARAAGDNGVFIPLSPERKMIDANPSGFFLAWVVLLSMGLAIVYSAQQVLSTRFSLSMGSTARAEHVLSWAVPTLALIGLAVASYLSYIEVTRVEAVCGPVGTCNVVQTSSYARLLGIPIAVLGALSYLIIIGLWTGQRFLRGRISSIMLLCLGIITVIGTGFSVYLTLIELYAIKAICVWCLSSAMLMTMVMVIVIKAFTK